MTISEIKDAVKHLQKGQSVDLPTTFNARKLSPHLHGIKDDDGYQKAMRCQTITGGVRVTCEKSHKFADISVVSVRHSA
jgi:hypothetical protein